MSCQDDRRDGGGSDKGTTKANEGGTSGDGDGGDDSTSEYGELPAGLEEGFSLDVLVTWLLSQPADADALAIEHLYDKALSAADEGHFAKLLKQAKRHPELKAHIKDDLGFEKCSEFKFGEDEKEEDVKTFVLERLVNPKRPAVEPVNKKPTPQEPDQATETSLAATVPAAPQVSPVYAAAKQPEQQQAQHEAAPPHASEQPGKDVPQPEDPERTSTPAQTLDEKETEEPQEPDQAKLTATSQAGQVVTVPAASQVSPVDAAAKQPERQQTQHEATSPPTSEVPVKEMSRPEDPERAQEHTAVPAAQQVSPVDTAAKQSEQQQAASASKEPTPAQTLEESPKANDVAEQRNALEPSSPERGASPMLAGQAKVTEPSLAATVPAAASQLPQVDAPAKQLEQQQAQHEAAPPHASEQPGRDVPAPEDPERTSTPAQTLDEKETEEPQAEQGPTSGAQQPQAPAPSSSAAPGPPPMAEQAKLAVPAAASQAPPVEAPAKQPEHQQTSQHEATPQTALQTQHASPMPAAALVKAEHTPMSTQAAVSVGLQDLFEIVSSDDEPNKQGRAAVDDSDDELTSLSQIRPNMSAVSAESTPPAQAPAVPAAADDKASEADADANASSHASSESAESESQTQEVEVEPQEEVEEEASGAKAKGKVQAKPKPTPKAKRQPKEPKAKRQPRAPKAKSTPKAKGKSKAKPKSKPKASPTPTAAKSKSKPRKSRSNAKNDQNAKELDAATAAAGSTKNAAEVAASMVAEVQASGSSRKRKDRARLYQGCFPFQS